MITTTQAAAILKKGGVIIFPTETVYGLAALAGNRKAERRIYALKSRPDKKPLPVQVASIKALSKLGVVVDDRVKKLARFWPGPLTLILKKGRRQTVGVRIPNHSVALTILKKVKAPLVVTSANRSGQSAATRVQDLDPELLDKVDGVVDGGPTKLKIESTIVDVSGKETKILRVGAISEKEIWKNVSYSSARATAAAR